jgi:two-component system, OmpR family, sensor kinase
VLTPRTLRGRLALTFAVTTTLLSAGFGAFLVSHARSELAHAIDEGLVPLAADLVGRIAREGPSVVATPLPSLAPPSDAFAQVFTPEGELIVASATAAETPLIGPGRARLVPTKSQIGERTVPKHRPATGNPGDDQSPGGRHDERVRFLAVPAASGGQRYVLLVATASDEATRLEHELELTLLLGLPALAVGVALGGWVLTGAMFKPVRAMIEQADTISASEAGTRLSIARGGAELTELGRRLDAMLDRIDAAVGRERAFLDEASHELRTPIAIVRGELELARAQTPEDTPVRAALDSTLDEVERLDRLAHNLLVLARSRSGKISESVAPVDLETVARRAVRAVSRPAAARGVQIRLSGSGVASGDELGLERATLNLLDNAVRFARGRVDVLVEEQNGWAHLEVLDDGPGFDPAVLPHAFDRFRAGEGEEAGGTGLGLAIVAAIAQAHGGSVQAENRTSGGARVRLLVPSA